MDVFESVVRTARPHLRLAATQAAGELGIWDALDRPSNVLEISDNIGVSPDRLEALLDVLAIEGVLERTAGTPNCYRRCARPDAQASLLPLEGWGRLAEVIRRDEPLSTEGGFATSDESQRKYQEHLLEVGRKPAEELTHRWLVGSEMSLLDLGGGAGIYTAAFLDANPEARAVLVDRPEVVPLAKESLGKYENRIAFVAGEIESVNLGEGHSVALMSNLLHLHGAASCRRLIECAVDALAVGGKLFVKDLRIEPDRSGPVTSVYFALNMALYTQSGTVHSPQNITSWIADAGLVDIEIGTLECSRDALVIHGRKLTS